MSGKTEGPADLVIELLVQSVETRLRVNGVAEGDALQIAVECGEDVREEWGGIGSIYIPKGAAKKHRNRNAEIWAGFTGNNYVELGRRYGLSEMRIRQIIAGIRRERRAAARDLGDK